MHPWPTAYTFLHRPDHLPLRVIITKATGTNTLFSGCLALEEHVNEPAPGTVAELRENAIVVRPSVGEVALHWLQPAGKRVMTAAEFIRGYHVKVGDRFGPERLP
jgi:methionyl-tRNA formyltransferase